MPYAEHDEKYQLARHHVSGRMCYSEKLTSNYEQSTNAERFMLGKESALLSYLQTKEETEKPLPEEKLKNHYPKKKLQNTNRHSTKFLREQKNLD